MSKNYYVDSMFDFFVNIGDTIGYDRETVTGHSILVGGIKRGCLAIGIKKPTRYAEITHLEFNCKCSVKALLTKGAGSINMVNIALYMAKTHFYPNEIDKIHFLDDSHIYNDNGQRVTLYWAYIATHNKTWYEMHFGAKFDGDQDYLSKLGQNINITLDIFMNAIIKNTRVNDIDYTDTLISSFNIAIQEKYTWLQLIQSLDKDIIYNCIGPNLDYLFQTIIGIIMPRTWYIDLAEWDHTKISANIREVTDSEISKMVIDVARP